MLFGYNTNGFAFHEVGDALAILHDFGYRAIGLTLDYHVLNPYSADVEAQAKRVGQWLSSRGMRCVVETGSRFLLDPRRKHQPTMISPTPGERDHRIDFLRRGIRVARILNADALSLWSGAALDAAGPMAWDERLIRSLQPVLEEARRAKMPLAFEPEPGMLVDTVARGRTLVERVADPLFGLTIDVGHVVCQSEGDVPAILKASADHLFNIHIEDMKVGVHDHLRFGDGDVDVPPILAALESVGYRNGVYVELSRHAHDAVNAAASALYFLRQAAP